MLSWDLQELLPFMYSCTNVGARNDLDQAFAMQCCLLCRFVWGHAVHMHLLEHLESWSTRCSAVELEPLFVELFAQVKAFSLGPMAGVFTRPGSQTINGKN